MVMGGSSTQFFFILKKILHQKKLKTITKGIVVEILVYGSHKLKN